MLIVIVTNILILAIAAANITIYLVYVAIERPIIIASAKSRILIGQYFKVLESSLINYFYICARGLV